MNTSPIIAGADIDTRSARAAEDIEYATLHYVAGGDSPEVIAEKAAKVLPRPNQTAWMRLERTFFIHFGPNTFNAVEWGSGLEEPAVFHPTDFDAEQWIRAIKDAGGRLVVLVCKHHDGLCLWQTRYTRHSVASSRWMDGKGDVVRAVAEAARKHCVKLGVYLSPADLYQLRTNPTNPNGYYGNESRAFLSAIPTDPAAFCSDPTSGREPVDGFERIEYIVDDYNRYFLNQLYELLTEYGPVDEVWFDGANPDPRVHQAYDYPAWYDLIYRLRPNATIAVKGPDVRWVGNEGGMGRETEWSVVPLTDPPDVYAWPDLMEADIASLKKLVPGSYLWWHPAETNVPILHGWFWGPGKTVHTAAELVDMYYQSIGRNGNWLLNLSPDNRGLVPDDQLAPLRLLARVIDETFAHNLASAGSLSTDSECPDHPASLVLDTSLDTWWEAKRGRRSAIVTLTIPAPATFDVVMLQEAVDYRGQRIEAFTVEAKIDGDWCRLDEQTTVGRKRLLRLDTPVTADQVRIVIADARLEPTLAAIGVFKQAHLPSSPVISERDSSGCVLITSPVGLAVVFTVDGSAPSPDSEEYASPIALTDGGLIQAACILPDGSVGPSAVRRFDGIAPIGWCVISVDGAPPDNEPSARCVLDPDPASLWLATREAQSHSLTVDMGRKLSVGGFAYLPRADGSLSGVVEEYSFETSTDGAHWTTQIDHGRFANIRNNPIRQMAAFAAAEARYFRFTAHRDVLGAADASAAHLTVLPAATPDSAQ